MTNQITCPTCGMTASENDHRLLVPLPMSEKEIEGADLRSCRNCGATIDLADSLPFGFAEPAS